ncbi:MAG: phosphatidylglycerophosphatase A [bacterium]|nr:phosphatidylglycerophosphatase A [bacterium]
MQKVIPIFIATGFCSGYSPVIPGTVGTIVGVIIYLLFRNFTWWQYGITLIACIALAIWSATIAEQQFHQKDCPKIVIDEIIGYLIAMFLNPFRVKYIVISFVIFRIIDIIKPYPGRQSQKLSGGLGIVADDVIAGIYTNVLLQIMWRFNVI